MSSHVLVNGVKSTAFPIKQGVRQGSVTSTWFFLLFIDNLLHMLQESGTGCTIGSLRLGNPTLADDLVLISPNMKSLEKALDIVYEYSKKWRFSFNMTKCNLVVFSPKRPPSNLMVKFGPAKMTQNDSATHVGIELHTSIKSSSAINARIQKGRSSLFSILAIEQNTNFVSPVILSSILEKVCFPTVLYGAELWHSMTASDNDKLERFIRLTAKSIQKFPVRTRTDIALGMLDCLPMRARVEQRKLMFLQKLCTLSPETLARQVFDLRFNLFTLKGYKNQLGFIPDIWELVQKYNLQEYVQTYLRSSIFPSKLQWKNIIQSKINHFYEIEWHERLQADADFNRFKTLHPSLEMSVIWKLTLDISTAPASFLVARLWSKVHKCESEYEQCLFCSTYTIDIYKHVASSCPYFLLERLKFINHVKDHVNADIGNILKSTDFESFFCSLLGRRFQIDHDVSSSDIMQFLSNSFRFVNNVIRAYGAAV